MKEVHTDAARIVAVSVGHGSQARTSQFLKVESQDDGIFEGQQPKNTARRTIKRSSGRRSICTEKTDRSALTADDLPRRIPNTHLNHNNMLTNELTDARISAPLKFPLHKELTLFSFDTHTPLSCSAEGSDPAYFLVDHDTI